MKLLSLFLLPLLLFSSINDINKKIAGATQSRNSQSSDIKKNQQSLKSLATKIKRSTTKLTNIGKKLKSTQSEINSLIKSANSKRKDSTYLKKEKKSLIDKRSDVERKLVDIIIKYMVYANAMGEQKELNNVDDIINQEIFKSLNKILKKESKSLKNSFVNYDKQIKKLNISIAKIDNIIGITQTKEKEFLSLKHEQKSIISELEKEKYIYKKRLQKAQKELSSAKNLLEKLNITKKKAIAAERKKEEAKEKKRLAAERKKQRYSKDIAKAKNKKVKKVGSSYQGVKRQHYRGKKLSAPLKHSSVIKKFGPYIDPIYDIKIHNDSITLKSKQRNALVRTILKGKVIFAKEVSLLGKTIIIKHQNDMHTIYSNLSKIAPGIKPGKYVRDKSVIGRVEDVLKFEVTKSDIPINPLEVIKVTK